MAKRQRADEEETGSCGVENSSRLVETGSRSVEIGSCGGEGIWFFDKGKMEVDMKEEEEITVENLIILSKKDKLKFLETINEMSIRKLNSLANKKIIKSITDRKIRSLLFILGNNDVKSDDQDIKDMQNIYLIETGGGEPTEDNPIDHWRFTHEIFYSMVKYNRVDLLGKLFKKRKIAVVHSIHLLDLRVNEETMILCINNTSFSSLEDNLDYFVLNLLKKKETECLYSRRKIINLIIEKKFLSPRIERYVKEIL